MRNSRAILLRKRRLSETSLIVHWSTDSLGLVQTVARGARRAKSPFRGLLDLFFEAEISVAFSKKTDLHTLREVTLLNPFAGIRSSHRRAQTASYFVELIEACTESEHHEPAIFDLLRRAFAYLDQSEPDVRALLHFEGELARIAGVGAASGKSPALSLANLFGRLPAARAPLLKTLRDKSNKEAR